MSTYNILFSGIARILYVIHISKPQIDDSRCIRTYKVSH